MVVHVTVPIAEELVTEFYQPDDIYIISNNNELPEPILVNSGEALSEQYEGF